MGQLASPAGRHFAEAVYVRRVLERSGVEQKLDALWAPKRRGPMEWSFASGSAVAHKGAGFNAGLGRRIWVSAVCR